MQLGPGHIFVKPLNEDLTKYLVILVAFGFGPLIGKNCYTILRIQSLQIKAPICFF